MRGGGGVGGEGGRGGSGLQHCPSFPAIAVLLPAGRPQQDWVTDGSLDGPRFDQIGKAHEPEPELAPAPPAAPSAELKPFSGSPSLGWARPLFAI